MAFAQKELSLMAYTGADVGFRQWAYANSAEDDVTAANFFDDAATELKVNDSIYTIDDGLTYRVSAIADGAVTVVANYAAPA